MLIVVSPVINCSCPRKGKNLLWVLLIAWAVANVVFFLQACFSTFFFHHWRVRHSLIPDRSAHGCRFSDIAGADSTNHIGYSSKKAWWNSWGKDGPSTSLATPHWPHAMEQMRRQLELCWIWKTFHVEVSVAVKSLSAPCTPTACL